MDYEKKYKEAVNKIKNLLDDGEKNGFTIVTYKTDLESIFPELAESEDERIRKEIIDFVKSRGGFKGDWIVWLEKQGEVESDNDDIEVEEKGIREAFNKIEDEKQCKQKPQRMISAEAKEAMYNKPADKVEPKFKVGDWVVYYRNDSSREVLQVYDIRDSRYYFTDNVHFSWSVKECDEKSHLWTIQDAKDGEVLAEHETIVLFKAIEGQNIRCYCTYHYLGFNPDLHVDTLHNKNAYSPATKEQRELLFQKMREAGYEWDAEKKELREIEQKPAWSKEDEERLQACIDCLQAESLMGKVDTVMTKWLESLKQRIVGG